MEKKYDRHEQMTTTDLLLLLAFRQVHTDCGLVKNACGHLSLSLYLTAYHRIYMN